MELPPLTLEQLSQLVASNSPPSKLFETLTEYEQEACLALDESGASSASGGDTQLLSLFYSSFFLVHLLTDQVLVFLNDVLTTLTLLTKLHRAESRALTERVPANLKQHDPTLQNCLSLLRAVWQTKHGQVYQILRESSWPDVLQPLIRRYESMSPVASWAIYSGD